MQDLLLDSNGDLQVPLARGKSSGQHQQLLLMLEKGQIKENPESTIGIVNYINESEIDDMVFEIRKRFEADGMAVNSIAYDETTGDLSYDANYKN